MIISSDIKKPLDNIVNKINDYPKDVQSVAVVHGSSANLKRVFFVSDMDVEYWMRYQNNKKNLFNNFNDIITLLLNNKMYFYEIIAGDDDRFSFNFRIKKNGTIINYDSKKIFDKINNLYKEKIINEEDLKKIIKYIIDKPTLISVQKLENILNEYKKIHWAFEEYKKGEKFHYNKKFKLYELFMNSVFLCNFVFEYSKGKYILFDLAIRVFSLSDKFKNLTTPKNKSVYDLLVTHGNIYGEISRRTTSFYYDSIFKNYVIGHYLKMLKRLKSLLSEIYFRPDIINIVNHNLNKQLKQLKYKKLIRYVIDEINNVIKSKKISCLNQLKNRIDTIIILTKYKEELEIKRLIIELLNNLKENCNFYPSNINKLYDTLSNYNKDTMIYELKEFKNILLKHLNDISLEYLKIYINKLQFILPFKIELPLKDHTIYK